MNTIYELEKQMRLLVQLMTGGKLPFTKGPMIDEYDTSILGYYLRENSKNSQQINNFPRPEEAIKELRLLFPHVAEDEIMNLVEDVIMTGDILGYTALAVKILVETTAKWNES